MPQQFKRIHYVTAGIAFFVAFITYVLTMQPTIPFWDCGEFAAAASALQVPHPPGAPLWTIVGRIAMMLPTFADPAARYNLFSVLSSAVSIMLVYLTLVRLIRLWRGFPKDTADAIILFGGSLIGALAYCWTDSFWFNAMECEVYAFGSLFISLVPWLFLIWYDHAEEEHSEKYLLLCAYVIGLSLGVHQLALLTMFPGFMFVYYRRRENVTVLSWFGMVGLSVVAFFVIFWVILSNLVAWAGNGKSILAILALAAIIGSIIYGETKKKANFSLSGWTLMMIFLGYTTYMFVMVRGAQNPPMNENAPSSFSKLAGYINRDQYGAISLKQEFTERRVPKDAPGYHPDTWDETRYSSDLDFFWKYQTNFMFHRYLGWNFIGRDGDFQGAGVDFMKTWALPFVLGLFGIYWHFKRDPKRALTLLGAFIVMGYIVDWYQNQQDPQPRERDYFYVGAFYIFAMWIGIGSVGIMEWVRERYAAWDSRKMTYALSGVGAVILIFGPINQCVGISGMLSGEPFSKSSKWAEYSRHNNWIPWEYAYNILQSCEPNAILFTYGDNDTFPLWCLQDSYAIRRDVRIVQLQLVTMMWNVKQLRIDNAWGGKAIKLTTFTDDLLKLSDDEVYRALDWKPKPVDMPISAETARWITGDSSATATVFGWTPKYVEPSDQVVADIIRNNFADRPICYSVTVPQNSRAGLNNFLVYEGMTARVTPFQQPPDQTGVGGSIQPARFIASAFDVPTKTYSEPHRGMILNTYRDPDAHRSGMDDDYAMTYRSEFLRLASWSMSHGDQATARRALDTMEARIPIARVPLDFSFASFIADLADRAGDWAITRSYSAIGVKRLREQMKNAETSDDNGDQKSEQKKVEEGYELANLEMRSGDLASARRDFNALRSKVPPQQALYFQLKMDEVDARQLEADKKYDSAYRKFTEILHSYGPAEAPGADLQDIKNHISADSVAARK